MVSSRVSLSWRGRGKLHCCCSFEKKKSFISFHFYGISQSLSIYAWLFNCVRFDPITIIIENVLFIKKFSIRIN